MWKNQNGSNIGGFMENYPVMTPEEHPKSNPENSPGGNFEKQFQMEEEYEDIHIPYGGKPVLGPDGKPINFFDFYKKPKKKKLDNLDKYLIFTFTSLILYTIVSQILFYVYQMEMAVLTGCFFAAFGGEILMCALIKKLKLHKEAELKKDDSDTFT